MIKIYSVVLEVRGLFHRLAAASDALQRDLGITASQRAVLEALAERKDETVPGIARAKGVTRQHIQTLANGLLETGLIEQRPNPAHKRSPILALTPAGRKCFAEITAREKKLLRAMAPKFRRYDLASVAGCLREMSRYLESVIPAERPQEPPAFKRRR